MSASCFSAPAPATISQRAAWSASRLANGRFAHAASAIQGDCSNTGPMRRTNSSRESELISVTVRKFILFHANRLVFWFAARDGGFLLEVAHDSPSAGSLADRAADRNKINQQPRHDHLDQAGAPSLLHDRADADFLLKVLDESFGAL